MCRVVVCRILPEAKVMGPGKLESALSEDLLWIRDPHHCKCLSAVSIVYVRDWVMKLLGLKRSD